MPLRSRACPAHSIYGESTEASHPDKVSVSKITEDAQIDSSPFVSEGGRWLVFARGRGSKRSIWIRDNSRALRVSSGNFRHAHLVARLSIRQANCWLMSRPKSPTKSHPSAPGSETVRCGILCHGCGAPSGWFDTDRAFFYREGMPSVIKMADPRHGNSSVVLQEDGAELSDSSWSPANEMMLFTETKG